MTAILVLLALGFAGGFLAGMLGLGGGIIMAPLLLFVPALLGVGAYNMKTVAAMSTVQAFFAALAGTWTHRRHGHISKPLVVLMGSVAAISGFVGAYLSQFANGPTLVLLFAVMSTAAMLMMFLPIKEKDWRGHPDQVPFDRMMAVLISLVVGLLGGAVGVAGAFLFVPLMIYVLKLPTRLTVGSTLVIVLLTSFFSLLGKGLTGQIPWSLSLALAAGSIPGARLGAHLSSRLPAAALRYAITVLIGMVTVRLWVTVFGGGHVG